MAHITDAPRSTDIVLQASFLVAEHLSFERLEQSWYELVVAWPLVSARIRADKTGPSGLAYHVPSPRRLREIQAEAPSLAPTKRQFYCLDESPRPLSSLFAASQPASERVRVYVASAPLANDERRLTCANATRTHEEYLANDVPLMSVQVTRFAHDTVVTISTSHVVGDGFSIRTVLSAWLDILHGRGPPAPLKDLGMDPFLSLAREESPDKPPRLPRGFHLFDWKDKARFLTNALYDLYVARPERNMEQRYVFLPSSDVAALLAETSAYLESKGAGRVNKSDVLYAWLMKNSHAGLPGSWLSTPLTIINARGRLPSGLGPVPAHDFWGAAFASPLDSLSVGDILAMPLGELALHIRRSVDKQSEEENARASLAFTVYHQQWKDKAMPGKPLHFFSPPNHRWSGISDWRGLKLFDLDFGPAVLLQAGEPARRAPVVTVCANMICELSKRDRWVCIGESPQGVWFTGYMSRAQWAHPDGFGRYLFHPRTSVRDAQSRL